MLDDIFILLIFFIGFAGILVLGGLFELVLNFFSEEAVRERRRRSFRNGNQRTAGHARSTS